MNTTMQELEQALANQEFELQYQPKVNILKGSISGAECLIRWNHPDKGFVSPDEFIPLAEKTGVITDITAHIVSTAINAIKDLRADGFGGSLAINTSPLDFKTNVIVGLLQDALDQNEIAQHDLQIELTETAALDLSLIHI